MDLPVVELLDDPANFELFITVPDDVLNDDLPSEIDLPILDTYVGE
jgi:hypothetical protein